VECVEKVLVSACLLGARVRYDGGAKTLDDPLLATWRREGRLISLCPEMAAGLPTPRAPAEIAPGATADAVLRGRGAIYDRDGLDMTRDFAKGADLALQVAQEHGCRFALLTDGSPSCGSTRIHSGEFNGQTHAGQGVVAARLQAAGIRVFAPHHLAALARALEDAENSTS
jgi:uncharacterized protein YbbK (DUF523 family)